jgi:ABC-2 type transport system permease protein
MTALEPRPALGSADRLQLTDQEMHLVAPRRSVRQHVVDVWNYRELLSQLIRRELKVKYKNSALGFAWSLLNPAFTAGIYYVVFVIFLRNPQQAFHIWLLSGLLIWQFFATSLVGGTMAVTSNAFLVGKVRFPREVLPLAAVGAALVHFFLQLSVLFALALAGRYPIDWAWMPMALLAVAICLLMAASLAMLLATVNVYARDTQHLLEIALQLWFWLSAIIVSYGDMAREIAKRGISSSVMLLNPMVPIITTMQRFVYGKRGLPGVAHANKVDGTGYVPDGSYLWYLRNLGVVFVAACVLFVVAVRVFDRAEGNFAEVL